MFCKSGWIYELLIKSSSKANPKHSSMKSLLLLLLLLPSTLPQTSQIHQLYVNNGEFTKHGSITSPLPVNTGHILTVSTGLYTPCPPGYFCPLGTLSSDPLSPCGSPSVICPGRNPAPSLVDKGHYSAGGPTSGPTTRTEERLCPPGHYCKNGVMSECLAGYYGTRSGNVEPSCDGLCEEGYYCPKGELTHINDSYKQHNATLTTPPQAPSSQPQPPAAPPPTPVPPAPPSPSPSPPAPTPTPAPPPPSTPSTPPPPPAPTLPLAQAFSSPAPEESTARPPPSSLIPAQPPATQDTSAHPGQFPHIRLNVVGRIGECEK